MRELLKSAVSRIGLAQQFYGGVLYSAGRRYQKAGQLFQAFDKYCAARRRIPSESLTRRHARAMDEILNATCRDSEGRWVTLANNKLLREFQTLEEADSIRHHFDPWPPVDRVRLRDPGGVNDDPGREGNLIVLKLPDHATGERGVILLKYNTAFPMMPALFDMSAVVQRYRIVLEPSTSKFIEPHMFLYLGSDHQVLVQCNIPLDLDFFNRLDSNLIPIAMGAGDWVDWDLFRPEPSGARDFDIVMVAGWAKLKRHSVLFQALSRLSHRRFKVALVGYPLERTRDAVLREARQYGVEDWCTIFEAIPPSQVASILARSRVALHLSKFEGANKSIYEAFFSNTPAIIYRHNIGFNMAHINPSTGILASDDELPAALEWMVEHQEQFQPRKWALENTGYDIATKRLNLRLQLLALERGEPWTCDIVPKVNRPNLRYKWEEDRLRMQPGYDELIGYLVE